MSRCQELGQALHRRLLAPVADASSAAVSMATTALRLALDIPIADATAIRLGIASVDPLGGRRATRSEDTANVMRNGTGRTNPRDGVPRPSSPRGRRTTMSDHRHRGRSAT
jgi:hypothetical protein